MRLGSLLLLQCWRLAGGLVRDNWNPQLPDVLFSVKTARYIIIPHGWKAGIRPFDLCSYRMTLFVNVFARGGWLEPDNPVNQAVIRRLPQSTYLKSCVTLHWLTCFVFIFHLISWSVTCIAFKFCCTLSHAVLNDNKDRTINSFSLKIQADPRRFRTISNRDRMHILWAFQEPNTY